MIHQVYYQVLLHYQVLCQVLYQAPRQPLLVNQVSYQALIPVTRCCAKCCAKFCIKKDGRQSEALSTEPIPDTTPSLHPSNDSLQNEIKALPGRKFTGDELTTYGDAKNKKISGFNTNSIKLEEIRLTYQESIDQQIDIQYFQEVCRNTRNSTILQRFLIETKRSDRASKSVWDVSIINVDSDYNPGGTAVVAFGKTTRRVIQQKLDNLGRWPWIAFKGEDNKVILAIYKSQRKGSL